MKKGWPTNVLGELCAFENGDRGENYPSESVQTTSGGPFINAGHLSESGIDFSDMNYIPRERFELLGNGKIRKDDVLFCLRGSLGKFASVGDLSEGAIASSLVIIRPNSALLNKFLLAYLQSDLCAEMIHAFKNGAAQPNLAAASLKKFQISVPPLAEQRRIVGILDEAFAGLATAKANAEKNLQNARALFESQLQSVFTNRGKDWMEKTIDQVCFIGDGNHSSNYPRKEELVEEGVPFIRATNMVNGRVPGENMRFLSAEKHAQLKKGHLQTGDILLTNRGEIGKTAIVDEEYDNTNLNSQIAWLGCREEMDNGFLFHALNSPHIQWHFQSAKNGAALQQFTIRQLKELRVPQPPKPEQKQIVAKLDTLATETHRLESLYAQKQAALAALKKSLLHRAFSGEL